jgi:hypothetical protein
MFENADGGDHKMSIMVQALVGGHSFILNGRGLVNRAE